MAQVCNLCGFNAPATLDENGRAPVDTHLRDVHQVFTCLHCTQTFGSSLSYLQHLERVVVKLYTPTAELPAEPEELRALLLQAREDAARLRAQLLVENASRQQLLQNNTALGEQNTALQAALVGAEALKRAVTTLGELDFLTHRAEINVMKLKPPKG